MDKHLPAIITFLSLAIFALSIPLLWIGSGAAILTMPIGAVGVLIGFNAMADKD